MTIWASREPPRRNAHQRPPPRLRDGALRGGSRSTNLDLVSSHILDGRPMRSTIGRSHVEGEHETAAEESGPESSYPRSARTMSLSTVGGRARMRILFRIGARMSDVGPCTLTSNVTSWSSSTSLTV
jgi:hypothetical protein